MSDSLSGEELRRIFGSFATGVTIVTGVHPDGRPVGVTANSFSSVSLTPPLVLWCLAHSSTSLQAFSVDAPFAVHVLRREQTEIALHFSRSSPQKIVPTSDWLRNPEPPTIAGALARIDCRVVQLIDAGDHRIVLGRVERAARAAGEPLLFYAGRFGEFVAAPRDALPEQDAWSNVRDAAPSSSTLGT
ncbi:MAG: flavin reductase family protein [Steroidobacteraceae bacterium]|nr:flavin reductase family protein [Steroidobacteraceae bacterium]MDW8260240.1 flavin reductase family protein [Gammaproteobacteria bacterium]